MQFETLVKQRQSCRNFDETKAVEREKLEYIASLARYAPSACNSQPYAVSVVTEENLVKDIAKSTQGMGMNKHCSKARAFIVINEEFAGLLAKTGGRLKDQDFASVDIGLLCAHIALAAADCGLSTCIIGWFDEKRIKELLGIDEKKRVRLVLAAGYAAEDDVLREKKRKEMDKFVKFY
ncbi:MAG: NAD(P)H nitroreductase [Bacillota bacterium]|nr:MAG: NAD(P)H nitroreductase [Bacillota bacterium]